MTPLDISVLDMHTGGEPVRIVRHGWPVVPGDDILAKRRFVMAEHDHLRRFLMFEPRGHSDMYGALLVEPTLAGADLAVLFMHNEGWSTMCGHAVIALGRFAVDHGLVEVTEPVTRLGIEAPCGLIETSVAVTAGKGGAVGFESVPAFALALDHVVEVPGHGAVRCDVAYGGAFYAIAPAAALGVDLDGPVSHLVEAADGLSRAVRASLDITHPDAADLSFLYGSILTDGGDGLAQPSRNVCVFAAREVDRSPTGSGVTARLAALAARQETRVGQRHRFASLTGAIFSGAVVGDCTVGPHHGVTVAVGGRAHYSGEARFWLEPSDEIGRGFLLK